MISFDFSRPSILRNMFIAFMAFGFAMGVVFPVFASLFVEWKEGMLVWFVVACILAGISIGLFNFWLLNKMLLQRLQRIGEVANAISQNDITHKCSLYSNDFIGDMANSFNLMTTNLRSMIQRIADVSTQLNQASNEVVEETSRTKHDIAKQKMDTKQVVEAIESMNVSVVTMSSHAESALSSVSVANKATAVGSDEVNKTVDSISGLATQVEEAAEVIKRLESDSETIGTILDVIKDIAEQTNLLALNAAIEAARAGEYGRGFAVVADEVRILASKTQESTGQIEGMIEKLQSASQEAVEVMESGRRKALQSVGQANAAGRSLKAIESSMAEIYQLSNAMTGASNEQKLQADSVSERVSDIQQISEHVANGAEKNNQSSQKVGDLAMHLSRLIGEFKTN